MDPAEACAEAAAGIDPIEGGPLGESIIAGDLSLLDPSDIDELELILPCERGDG